MTTYVFSGRMPIALGLDRLDLGMFGSDLCHFLLEMCRYYYLQMMLH